MLIFTLIFSPKTHKSYNITSFATANHPIFQKNCQKPTFPPIFRLFFSFFKPLFASNFLLFTCSAFASPRPTKNVQTKLKVL
jgi:hypothetical protein